MKDLLIKRLSVFIIVFIWVDLKQILMNLSFENHVFLVGFFVSAILSFIVKKAYVYLLLSMAITGLISVYHIEYIIWAVPALCMLFAHKISSDNTKFLRPLYRRRFYELIFVGCFSFSIPLVLKIQDYDPLSHKNVLFYHFIISLIFFVLFICGRGLICSKKIQLKEKQRCKLLCGIYAFSAICSATIGCFYKVFNYFLYFDYKIILLPWVLLFCFMIWNGDPIVELISNKIDLAFDKFSKMDTEKE